MLQYFIMVPLNQNFYKNISINGERRMYKILNFFKFFIQLKV